MTELEFEKSAQLPPSYCAHAHAPCTCDSVPASPSASPCCHTTHDQCTGHTLPRTVLASPAPALVYPPTDAFCPATGGPHVVRRRQGGVSILLSVVTFPVGLAALPFDKKQSCRRCNFVIKEAWGGY
ncbi:hypothetical protein CC85DRAFT_285660 [Cutaneotrichosporon oleaginosum]|uniref:Uncharacterized protein n=1 Tax=Cutaneotrichosporon oleaginosum TaxID=879819 RepID=A0A0J0XM97_9TREE|nr:uncharacterized protein CC85DRAFT_285660 [Cutaneotrichosporon oleaginosum]KLT42255.1 hypothetical protein CC85DRAFT_285660 [Cutaneotrichosporon oleaginosum]TXT11427.1 hypothetical protein COLE_01837 [Cutaneotrichosporon oleaginosum]